MATELAAGFLVGNAVGVGIMMCAFWTAGLLAARTKSQPVDRPFKLKVLFSYFVPILTITIAGLLMTDLYGERPGLFVWGGLLLVVLLVATVYYLMLSLGSRTFEMMHAKRAREQNSNHS